MDNKELIANIEIFSDGTIDAELNCKQNLDIFIAGFYQVIEKMCGNDKALKYGLISSFVLISGVDIKEIERVINEYEKQQ